MDGGTAGAFARGMNVGDQERLVSTLAGVVIGLYGLARIRLSGILLAALGGALVYRGVTGRSRLYRRFGVGRATTLTGETRGNRGIKIERDVVVNAPPDTLYRIWRNLENLPQFMPHLESVERVTDTLSRWRARGPGGKIVEWNAEIINEVPNQVIGWRSIEGSDVVSAGSVNFDDAGPGRGTRVTVHLQYSPPGGKVGAAVAKLLGRDAATEIREDLRRFKQIIEAGEVPSTKGQPRG